MTFEADVLPPSAVTPPLNARIIHILSTQVESEPGDLNTIHATENCSLAVDRRLTPMPPNSNLIHSFCLYAHAMKPRSARHVVTVQKTKHL